MIARLHSFREVLRSSRIARLALWAGSCVLFVVSASCASLETRAGGLFPQPRIKVPQVGRNNFHLALTDRSGGELEARLREAVCAQVLERGYELSALAEADYVLWAAIRYCGRLNEEGGRVALEQLMGDAAPDPPDFFERIFTLPDPQGNPAALAVLLLVEFGGDVVAPKDQWGMVIDLQLGRRLAGNLSLELEQRLVVQAVSCRKSREEVIRAMLDAASRGVAVQLPPVPHPSGASGTESPSPASVP